MDGAASRADTPSHPSIRFKRDRVKQGRIRRIFRLGGLTAHGRQVMLRETSVHLVLPDGPSSPLAASGSKALQTWRRDQASATGKPAYTVFSNATLADIARHRPTNDPALLAIKGIGPAKLTRYGADVLALVADHLTDQE